MLTLGSDRPQASALNLGKSGQEARLAVVTLLAPLASGFLCNFTKRRWTMGSRSSPSSNDRAYSVAAGFFVKTGSRDESGELAGVSHFLEHMTFKGTARRDAVAVNRDFDRVGAKHNAQTSEEDTFYHVTCLPEYLPQAFDVLSDILRPSLRTEDFETEKQVIIEEIRMYLDNPMSVAYEAAKAAHFGSHPLGNSILGTVESITAISGRTRCASTSRGATARQYRAGFRRQVPIGARSWTSPNRIAATGKEAQPIA